MKKQTLKHIGIAMMAWPVITLFSYAFLDILLIPEYSVLQSMLATYTEGLIFVCGFIIYIGNLE